jgi:hypothetical protein
MPAVDYPEDSFQTIAGSGDWWEPDDSREMIRGQLVWAHVQFYDEIPLQLLPIRADDRTHGAAVLRAEPLRANQGRTEFEALPVAALPRRDGADGFVVNRAKRRPCLVLAGVEPTRVTDRDGKGQPNWSVAPFAIVAPYYSADQEGRAGYRPALVERIRHARYRQFFYDRLPVGGTSESIMRFDQAFPVSHNAQSHERTGFRLSDRALTLVDEWLGWFVTGDAPQGELAAFRELIAATEAETGQPDT